MNLDLDCPHFDNNLQLNYLFDCSQIIPSGQLNRSCDLSICKETLNLSQKERTREQSYQDICKQINQAKLEQLQLSQQVSQLKQNSYNYQLALLLQEFQQLNKQNLILRAQHNQSTKIKNNKKQRLCNTSSAKPTIHKHSVCGYQNIKNFTKTDRQETNQSVRLKKKQRKITQNGWKLGKSQIKSHRVHRTQEPNLTERKMQNVSMPVSMDDSYFDQQTSHSAKRQGISKTQMQQDCENKNVFIQILENMLIEERMRDKQKYCGLYMQVIQNQQKEEIREEAKFVNLLEEEIRTSNQKLQMLTLLINKYQTQMQGMDINLKNLQEVYKKLYSVKGRFVEMQEKSSRLFSLRKEAYEKQRFLDDQKESIANENNESNSKNISSVQAMINILSNNPNKQFESKRSSLYFTYYQQIKYIFEQNNQQQSKQKSKMLRVRDMIQNIRQSRKKYNQLIQVYQARIAKLEQKIAKVRYQQTDKSSNK